MSVTEYLKRLEADLEAARANVARLELKLETAREMAEFWDSDSMARTPSNGLDDFRGMAPTEAILAYLKARGRSDRSTTISELAPVVDSTSRNPKNVLRTCVRQLVGRDKVVENGKTIELGIDT